MDGELLVVAGVLLHLILYGSNNLLRYAGYGRSSLLIGLLGELTLHHQRIAGVVRLHHTVDGSSGHSYPIHDTRVGALAVDKPVVLLQLLQLALWSTLVAQHKRVQAKHS